MSISVSTRTIASAPARTRPDHCPVEDWLGFLGHRWNALLLWHLSTGPKRHRELLELLPWITAKVLSERLDGLSGRGLIERQETAGFPRSVAYALTGGGCEVVAILDQFETLPQSFAGDVP